MNNVNPILSIVCNSSKCIMFSVSVRFPCYLEDGRCGHCLDVQQCPSTYKPFLDGEEIKDLCFYNGIIPIVCCPLFPVNPIIANIVPKYPRPFMEINHNSEYKIFSFFLNRIFIKRWFWQSYLFWNFNKTACCFVEHL